MAQRCGSCGKQARLRRVQVDVTNRYCDNLRFKVYLCGACAAALCDSLRLEGPRPVAFSPGQFHMPWVE